MCMHCKGFPETSLSFEALRSFILLLISFVICVCLLVVQSEARLGEVRGIHASYSGRFMLYSKTLGRQESVICSYLLHLV